jgi:hypothetical protein
MPILNSFQLSTRVILGRSSRSMTRFGFQLQTVQVEVPTQKLVLMACGHTPQVHDKDGNPKCVLCDESSVAQEQINLEGRESKCMYCGRRKPSRFTLPFFRFNRDREYDEHDDGCRGYD